MTAASPEPTDGSWAAPAGSGANPVPGDGTWTTADASPPPPPAPDVTGPPASGNHVGPWATPPAGWRAPGNHEQSWPPATGAPPGTAGQGPPIGPVAPGPDLVASESSLTADPGTDAPLDASGDGPWVARAPRIPLKQRLGAAGLTAVVVAVVGAPLGLLWAVIAPGVPIIKTDDGAVFATPSPEEFIAADGWFTILMFALGVVAALATWIGFKRYRGPLTLCALLVGTVGASILAWQVGKRIGVGDYRAEVLAAQPGDMIIRPPDLRAGGFTKLWDVIPFVHGDLLIATFGTVIVYTLLAGWSRTPSLRPETRVPLPTAQPTNPFYVLNDPTQPPALGAPGVPTGPPGSAPPEGGQGAFGGPPGAAGSGWSSGAASGADAGGHRPDGAHEPPAFGR
ncbi:DUF2567 domain-containing protein [Asanoa iriomotensis]|uniref:DUF2567 domain-containing protein n=1 Tax=Asanoa iriomotensis TaxID=234613 RepID=A0ABQ4CAA6_9ACTN|nr:DUF2567 domain-containing protein [Asanoa iriomotensis]GIF59708.1 hypothetical protein Air01nite_58030 [Asanoa iriomotensis]